MFILYIQYADNSVVFEKFSSLDAAEDALELERIKIDLNGGIEISYAEINEGLGS